MIQFLITAALLLPVAAPSTSQQQPGRVAASPSAPLVIGQTFTLASSVLKEERRINVYAPPGYAESASLRLPVLYAMQGKVSGVKVFDRAGAQILEGSHQHLGDVALLSSAVDPSGAVRSTQR